ncbi:transglycosylase SLT domain-containing protein [Afipia felis]|uniref:Soluble lytic murein transglycosylase n=2 Tax=Afipia felis TaxID=1035 RepID=A0A380W5L0_AFIFE|nr:transglycosylase SLT domain-containing protein [Afipia felis]EKS26730.1 hypothetical protein HMPREF9697_03988 [Afipia felis ATCC 53690]SUU76171.1 Soluble lytic murein transglycosylase precursor [Afipia felis]SUU84238.1 Soluble lytic murein transglycosylase precursor [Afipia felis]
MAGGLPDYQERVTLGGAPSPSIQPIPLQPMPHFGDTSAIGKALSGLGAELTTVATKLAEGEQNTKASEAMAGFLQDRAELTDRYSKDPDYTTAGQRFQEDITYAQRNRLEGIDDPTLRAKTSLEMTRDTITASNKVQTAQFKRQADINVAALDQNGQASLAEAIDAQGPERQAVIERYARDVERLRAAGWITAENAVQRGMLFKNNLDSADIIKLVQTDPAAAVVALNDPAKFSGLDPTKRASYLVAAEQRADAAATSQLTNTAAFHPEAASLAAGRVITPMAGQKIFDNGIVPIESDSDPKAVSPKGALGLTQIMPDTAREVAGRLGLKDVAALDDNALKQRLLDDQDLNLRLGRTYWNQMVSRYNGNVVLAAAAYNAGPGRADNWQKIAQDKFGPAPSPQQIASVVDIKETQDYLAKLYGRFGAPMDVKFSSPTAALSAVNSVGSVLQQQQAREDTIVKAQAAAVASSDPLTQLLKDGYDVAPARIQTYQAAQQDAANRGDAAAAGRLRDLDYALRMQPMVRRAWSTPPVDLDTAIHNMEARLSAPGANVTQDQTNALTAFKAVRDEQIKRRDVEPVTLGGQDGARYYTLEPIKPDAPLDDNLIGALKNRDAQAQTANRVFGGNGSPFTKQEALGWKQRYADATPQERGEILGTLARGLSPDSLSAVLPQIIKGENSKSQTPALTIAAGLYNSAPDVAQSIIEGMNAQDAEKRYLPSGSDANAKAYQVQKDQYLPLGMFNRAARTDPSGPYAALSAAIDARYAFLSAQAKDTTGAVSSSRLQQAISDVTGGVLYHNGAPLIAPARGMDQRVFDGVMTGLTDDNLKGAQTTSGKHITADYVRGSGKLQSRADGTYYLQLNQDNANPQYAVTKGGTPFVLDLRGRQPVQRSIDPFTNAAPLP